MFVVQSRHRWSWGTLALLRAAAVCRDVNRAGRGEGTVSINGRHLATAHKDCRSGCCSCRAHASKPSQKKHRQNIIKGTRWGLSVSHLSRRIPVASAQSHCRPLSPIQGNCRCWRCCSAASTDSVLGFQDVVKNCGSFVVFNPSYDSTWIVPDRNTVSK